MNNNKKKIREFMAGRKIVSREEIIMRFGGDVEVPSYEELSGRYIAWNIAQALASAKDKKGRRQFLARRSYDKIDYVNIEGCEDILSLEHVRDRIASNIAGQETSLKKVDLRLEKVRQLKLSDLLPGGDVA